MEFKLNNIESVINKKLRNNQLLLVISVLLSVGVVIWRMDYVYWAMYFALIGALNLPNINKCKKDLIDYKNNSLSSVKGQVLDFFPESDVDNGNWILFLNVEGEKDVKEFILSSTTDIKVDSIIEVFHTNLLHVPVRVCEVSKTTD